MRLESILVIVAITITLAACTIHVAQDSGQDAPSDTIPSEREQTQPGEWKGQPPGNLTGRDMTRDGRPPGNFSEGMGPGGSGLENVSISACRGFEEGATCEMSIPRGTVSGTCQTKEETEGLRCVPTFNRP